MSTNPNLMTPKPSFAEQSGVTSVLFKSLARRIASGLRCGLPGVITDFNYTTQYVKVKLAIAENVLNRYGGGFTSVDLPILEDVLLMLPGDAGFCLTFPNVIGSECYVCFADMCVNAWATHGMQKNSNGKYQARKQEIQRRHDLSDGFAILAPRSQPNAIPNYSTTNVELRSMDGTSKIALTNAGKVLLKGNGLEIDGSAGVINAGNTVSRFSILVTINGTNWYVRLSDTP